MCAKTPRKRPQQQLLGEIETEIVGLQYFEARLEPGEYVSLEREHNPHDPSAVRVENGRFQPVGHLSRRVSSWLSPLLDAGWVRVEGYVPEQAAPVAEGRAKLALMVFLTRKGQPLLVSRPVETKLDEMHSLALWVYHDARRLTKPELIAGLADGLQPLLHQDLLPESKLLLALIPGMAKELRAARGVQSIVTLRAALEQLVIGQPLICGGLTAFPLSWPQIQQPPYALLSRAIESGTAVVEEVNDTGGAPQLCVHNKNLRPLLIPEGEIFVDLKQPRGVNRTVLVAAKSTATLPMNHVGQRRPCYRSDEPSPNHEPGPRRPEDAGEHFERTDAKLRLPEDAAGMVVARDGKILGLDLFDAPTTLAELWPRISEACFLRGIQREEVSRPVGPEQVRQFLNTIVNHARPSIAAFGLGKGLEIDVGGLTGTVLLYADRICHVKAFIKTT